MDYNGDYWYSLYPTCQTPNLNFNAYTPNRTNPKPKRSTQTLQLKPYIQALNPQPPKQKTTQTPNSKAGSEGPNP